MRQALLLMDFQRRAIVAVPGAREAMAAADRARVAARAAGIQVIHVRVAFHDGHPEIPPWVLGFDARPDAAVAAFEEKAGPEP